VTLCFVKEGEILVGDEDIKFSKSDYGHSSHIRIRENEGEPNTVSFDRKEKEEKK
jgi:hypothetical protein